MTYSLKEIANTSYIRGEGGAVGSFTLLLFTSRKINMTCFSDIIIPTLIMGGVNKF